MRVERTPELPYPSDPGVIYVGSEGGYEWHAVFLCPCGCEAVVGINLVGDSRPAWTLAGPDDAPTIAPSILRLDGCRSHFFIRGGEVEWA